MVLLVVSIPLAFYANLALKHAQTTQRQELIDYARTLKQRIYSIREEAVYFTYPRSLLFRSAILDEAQKPLFSLLEGAPSMETGEFRHERDQLFYKTTLQENRLGARYLIVSKDFSYNDVLIEFLALLGVVLLTLFFSSFWVLRHSIKPFEEANHYMKTFFKDAMHELKTPLGIIQLNLEILRQKLGDHRGFERSQGALKVLVTLFEDIEFFIKNRHMNYLPACTSLSLLLQDRLDYFDDIAKTKEIALSGEIEAGVWVEMSEAELQRILDNTLSNALKYTHPKKRVKARLYRAKEGKNRAILEIEDEGIGIKDTQAIFGRYHRGDTIRGGFGIGLSIVKKICEKYGVEISVRSRLGKGSLFGYAFPLVASGALAGEKEAHSHAIHTAAVV